MATFVLKKYSDNKEEAVNPESKPGELKEGELTPAQKEEEESLQIEVSGSISSIVAAALHKVLQNKHINLDIIEQENEETAESTVKAITTEDINSDPLKAFRSINKADVVFISSEGFKTKEEEWFLTNLPNKTDKVFYTVESFATYLVKSFESKQDVIEADTEEKEEDDESETST